MTDQRVLDTHALGAARRGEARVAETGWQRCETVAAHGQAQLADHRLYGWLRTRDDLRTFMEHHVFAVWDFMSLLMRLAQETTCTTAPWVPATDDDSGHAVARAVNELRLAEETDEIHGIPTSHFHLYRLAMAEVGADLRPINATVAAVTANPDADVAGVAESVGAPPGAVRFVRHTFHVVRSLPLPSVAAAFALGREQLIPTLFSPLVNDGGEAPLFRVYLERHIALDGDEHAGLAETIVGRVCGSSAVAWEQAVLATRQALEARARLWSETPLDEARRRVIGAVLRALFHGAVTPMRLWA
ncbi:MAG: DUF3050 domain-containing protein [Chloroflexi bacterium]|nr:DUF3050 domain-containing protein [Chloroflexota bacterium]